MSTLARTGVEGTFVDGVTIHSGADRQFVHRWIETQGIAALMLIGGGIKTGFDVTVDTGLTVAIAPGSGVALDTTRGAVALSKSTPTSLVLGASDTWYIFATIENSGGNVTQTSGVPLFIAQNSNSLDGGTLLAKVVTGVATITSVTDMRALLDASDPVDLFAQDDDTTSGLDWGYTAGRVRQSTGTIVDVAAGTVTLTDNILNYVEIDSSGTVTANTTGWSSGQKAIAEVTTVSGFVTAYSDERVGFDFAGGSAAWADITGTPTTLAGYNISDAAASADLTTETSDRTTADSTLTTAVTAAQADIDAHEAATGPHTDHMLVSAPVMGADMDAGGFVITNAGTAVASTDVPNKGYVDGLIGASSPPLLAAKAASTANLTLSGEQTIDTVACVSGDRVLAKDQTTQSQNGVYVVAVGAWSRATDADTAGELPAGKAISILNGTANIGRRYAMISTLTTVGTDAMVWTLDSSGVGTGEANTASNGNSEGVGVYDSKSGVNLVFRGIVSTNAFLTVAYNSGTKAIRLTVNEAALTLNNLLGVLTATKGGTGQSTTATGDLLVGGAANTWLKVAGNATGTPAVAKMVSGVLTWITSIPGSMLTVFQASGASHAPGGVPDPGATAGTTRFMREDATWAIPPGSGGWVSTSTTSVTVPAGMGGTKTWFVGTGYAYALGQHIRGAQTSAPSTNYIGGTVTAYSAGNLSIVVDEYAGSGAHSDWTVSATGAPGTSATATTDASLLTTGTLANARLGTGIDAAKIGGGGVSSTEFDYLANVTSDVQTQLNAKEATANKDATGGYAGLTLFKINFKNAANTFTSFFTNSNTAARTYTFQDRNGTIADDTDLALKAPLASPALTGTPTVPTAAPGTNTTQAASTAYADAIATLKANIASPTFTGTPAAPTAAGGTNTTQLATTAFVASAIAGIGSGANASNTITLSGSSVRTLTTTEANARLLIFTGTITANMDIVMPAAGVWAIYNLTTGGFSLRIKVSSGSDNMVVVGSGEAKNFATDYTNLFSTLYLKSIAPTGISGLVYWGSADNLVYQDSARTTLVSANNDPVGSWTDRSSNANNAQQATSGNRPTYKTNVVNTLPAIQGASASSQYLQTASNTGITGAGAWTMVFTFKLLATTTNGTILSFGDATASLAGVSIQQAGTANQLFLNTTNVTYNATLTAVSGATFNASFYVCSLTYDGANVKYYINGALIQTRAVPFNMTNGPVSIFRPTATAGQYGDNQLVDVALFNSVLSSSNRNGVERYFATRADLTIS